jgi:hypothetical protein
MSDQQKILARMAGGAGILCICARHISGPPVCLQHAGVLVRHRRHRPHEGWIPGAGAGNEDVELIVVDLPNVTFRPGCDDVWGGNEDVEWIVVNLPSVTFRPGCDDVGGSRACTENNDVIQALAVHYPSTLPFILALDCLVKIYM